MIWPVLGCLAAVLLVLAWWHRVLLTTWSILATMWMMSPATPARRITNLLPQWLYLWLVNKVFAKLWLFQIKYAVDQVEGGIGGHCFEEDDDGEA